MQGKGSGALPISNPVAAMEMASSTLLHASNPISDMTNDFMDPVPTLMDSAQSVKNSTESVDTLKEYKRITQPLVDHTLPNSETNTKIKPTIKSSSKKAKSILGNSPSKYPAEDKPWDIKK